MSLVRAVITQVATLMVVIAFIPSMIALPTPSLSVEGLAHTSSALSAVHEGPHPEDGSMARGTKIGIPVALGLFIILVAAFCYLPRWQPVARLKRTPRPKPSYMDRLSHDLVLQPTISSGSSTTLMVQKVPQPPPLLHDAHARVATPFASASGKGKHTSR
ncbi:hypothetical protein FPV67DRAFT_755302 [Lyophyllum atratum]|nr:hypothetical protein FPV67DRAFT_755302 [Lyophyllum atratum]